MTGRTRGLRRWLAWEGLADVIRPDGEPEEVHPPSVRTALVDWATRLGPTTTPPPPQVATHLEGLFAAAEQAGKRQGIARGALVCVVLAVVLVVLVLVLRVAP